MRQNILEQQRTRLSISGVVFSAWSHIWDDLGKAHAFSLPSPCYKVTNTHTNSILRSGKRKSSSKGNSPDHVEPAGGDTKKAWPGSSKLSADPHPCTRSR